MSSEISKREKYIEEKDFVEYCKSLKLDITIKDLRKFSIQEYFYPYYSIASGSAIDLEYNIYKNPEHHASVISNGHPLDIAFSSANSEIERNSNQKEKNYYARWQILIIQELLSSDLTANKKMCSLQNYHLIKTIRMDFESKIIAYEPFFQTVTNYMMTEILLDDEAFKSANEQNVINTIEGDLLIALNEKIKTVSQTHFNIHTYNDWIKFIRKLVEIYNHYTDIEKYKLSEEVKNLLTTAVNIIIDSDVKPFDEICIDFDGTPSLLRKDENEIVFRSGDLKRIYPDDIELSIAQFKVTFKSITDEARIEELVAFIQSKGLEYIFLHIYDIEKIWFNREQYWQRKLWAYMRSLAVGIEFYAKDVLSISKLGDLSTRLGFIQTNGNNSISSHLDTIRIGDVDSLDDYLEKLNKLIEASKRPDDQYKDEYYYHIFYLTRNFFAHKFKVDNSMTGTIFYPIYESLKKVLLKVYEANQGNNQCPHLSA